MNCGDLTIDKLLSGDTSVPPLVSGAASRSVGHLHDLLRGHGYSSLADARSPQYIAFGPATLRAISDYRTRNSLPPTGCADTALFHDLISRPAPKGGIGPAYVPLVLDTAFTCIHRFIWLTALFETGGAFQTLNLNTDGCGISFGILQWSQKPGQLHRILQACHDRAPAEWSRIMGDAGDSLLAYTAKPNGGVDAKGRALDPAFELTKDPWKSKLESLGSSLILQRVQLDLASETYSAELARERAWVLPNTSERAFAFLLDLVNQFGPGRVEQHYKEAVRTTSDEREILQTLENVFVAIARPQFQPQVRARREFFRTTNLLSDAPLPA
jgi:hypothetical protein